MNYIIDAYAWIEYFNGSESGEKVRKIVENPKNTSYTNIVTVAEIASYFGREQRDFEEFKKMIIAWSLLYNIDLAFAEEVGALHAKIRAKNKHIGLADIFVLQTAKKLKGKVVTGDEDFRGLQETIMIK